ncbi:hypothetical protein HYH02_009065 [Chlamydomonas schloesseri]|uniref:PPM-type phosphatase domain-containing protein n=1 Tax=Chlamydomonas schloesseri TaxID=2026947 RepID=A0A835WB59_9CHLO|nr:hypothetical protein HYH02_009065 [Chlamydomonas schloesseri]|eukprot:KAG2444124.1 hypothetical protein HYH02_009065 [Chlamydomonas schloesseri]
MGKLLRAGEIDYEVTEEEGSGMPLLYAYIPAEFSSSDLEVVQGTAAVSIEHVATDRVLGFIELPGFEISQEPVKFSKKHRRYTIRLLGAAPPPPAAATAAAGHSPAKHLSGVAPPPPSGVGSTAASTANIFGLLDNDDVSDDNTGAGGEGATGGAKKKKKKKKKGKKAGAGGEGEVEGEGEDGGVLAEAAAEVAAEEAAAAANGAAAAGAGGSSGDEGADKAGGGEGATGGAKKKKKKKKKGGPAGGGGDEAEVDATEAALPERPASPPPRTPPDSAASGIVSRDSRSPSPPAPGSSSNAAGGSSAASPQPGGSAPLSKAGSRALSVSLESDFLPEGGAAFGDFEVGRAVDHDPLLGPAVHNALGKVQVKGEDRWLEAPSNSWSIEGVDGGISAVSAFGIFDGHGGRMAAQHAAKQLLPLVGRFAERALGPEPPTSPEQLVADGYLDPAAVKAAGQQGPEYEAALDRARVAAAQDALIARLPKALHAGFVQCDEEVMAKFKSPPSGTTATLAVQVGWELLVANVGDSLAYLDTGTEIVVISANHRVAENTEEQERILAAGGRIKPARYDEDEEGAGTATPHEGQHLRVWPGGINMTRTIGDEPAKGLLIPEPAIRQISLPVTGARLIMASDGLWDAVNAKTVIGQLRTCNAREAASKAAVYAMRNKKHDDDVTVVVADFVPRESDTHVPGLLKKTNGPAAVAAAALAAMGMREERAAQAWRPMEAPSDSWRSRHRAHRARAAAYLEQLAEAEAGEVAEAEARQRAVALAAGQQTVAAAAAGHRQPVSDTYRELAALKLDVTALHALDAEEDDAEDKGDEDNWTAVDSKKKKDNSGGAAQNMLSALARAAQPGTVKPAAGRGGRDRDRKDRDRERGGGGGKAQERDAAAAIAAAAAAAAAAGAAAAGAPDSMEGGERRGPRSERRDRRDRGGAGGRGPHGGSAGRPAAEGASLGGAPPAAPEGVVKSGGYLFVPKSLLTGGAGGGDGQGGEGGKPRRDRAPRPERGGRGGGKPRDGQPSSAGATADGGEDAAGGEGGADGGAAANGGAPRRERGPRDRKPRGGPKGGGAPAGADTTGATASPAAPAAYNQPAAAPAAHYAPAPASAHHAVPHTTHVPVASSSDPIVELGGRHRAHHHAAPQPHYGAAPAPAPTGVQTFAGPMDFGAGFGAGFSAAPGTSLWSGPGAAPAPAMRAPGGPTSGGGRGRGGAAPGAGRGGQHYRAV